MKDWQIIQGDARDLSAIEDGSVNCVVTSPPYYGLRDYGVDGQLGLEPTPEEYTANLVEVFQGVRRVLRDDGVLWLNLGDSYVGGNRTSQGGNENFGSQPARIDIDKCAKAKWKGLSYKNLIGIPWRVAFALQADGWWLRQDIIWHKPNPMPESVTDRCTKAHEYVFMLTKSARYFYDAAAVSEYAVTSTPGGIGNKQSSKRFGTGLESEIDYVPDGKRNRRSVWTIPTQPFPDAHFATYPLELVETCIKAGCPSDGVVLDPFAGAGTTGIAAMTLSRSFIGVELNPEYVDMARARIDAHTKQQTFSF